MIRLVAHWVGQGRSSMEILGHAADWTLAGYTVQQTRAEVVVAIEGARTRWGVPDTDQTVAKEPSTPFGEALFDPWGELKAPPFPIDALPDVAARLRRRARPHHGRRSLRARLGCVVSLQRSAGRTHPLADENTRHVLDGPSIALGRPDRRTQHQEDTHPQRDLGATSDAPNRRRARLHGPTGAEWKRLPKAEREDVSPPPLPTRLIVQRRHHREAYKTSSPTRIAAWR